MLAAFLTTLLFSISGVTANRSSRILPSLDANFYRLTLATLILAIYAHTMGAGLGGVAFGWFVASGFIGFGIGDLALFLAYPRLGSRLVILIVHCVAAPLAAAVEWTWLGIPMTPREMLASLLILSGVAVALFPDRQSASRTRNGFAGGIGFALIAAAGQGIGAVLSRRAFEIARQSGQPVDGISAAYQRILAGVLLSAVSVAWANRRRILAILGGDRTEKANFDRLRVAAPWVIANALAGPALGVSCFQWALAERGTGVVLPIVALTPLVIIPFAMHLEKEHPTPRSLIGGAVAVAGAVIHAASH